MSTSNECKTLVHKDYSITILWYSKATVNIRRIKFTNKQGTMMSTGNEHKRYTLMQHTQRLYGKQVCNNHSK